MCLPICIYGSYGKIQWNVITWKITFLQTSKHGRYYWYGLHTRDFKVKHLGEYHNLYIQSNTVLLAYLHIWELSKYVSWNTWTWPWWFSYCARISRARRALKKMKVKQDLLTDFDMLLMVEKVIRGGICHAIHRCAKANKKYIKDHAENRESPYLNYWVANDIYGWEKLYGWGHCHKTAMKIVMNDIFLKLIFSILKIYITFTMIYHFYLIE